MSTATACHDFNRRAETYDAHASVQREAAEWLAEWLPARIDGPALELGAGTGLFTRHLASLASNLTATDFSPRMVAEGNRLTNGARWMTADAASPPRLAAWRWIFSCSMVQWLPEPQHAFRKWHGAAAPGGRLLGGWFIAGTMLGFLDSIAGLEPFHWRERHEWLHLLHEAGWNVCRQETRVLEVCHASSTDLLRTLHRTGAVVPRRLGPGQLRRALRDHDRRRLGSAGLVTPFVYLRVEAQRQ